MRAGAATGAAAGSDDIACDDDVSPADEAFVQMRIAGLDTARMPYYYDITVAIMVGGQAHYPAESGGNLGSGWHRDVHTFMFATAASTEAGTQPHPIGNAHLFGETQMGAGRDAVERQAVGVEFAVPVAFNQVFRGLEGEVWNGLGSGNGFRHNNSLAGPRSEGQPDAKCQSRYHARTPPNCSTITLAASSIFFCSSSFEDASQMKRR